MALVVATALATGALVGAGGGTLFGLNENGKHDDRCRSAYAACMQARGYTSESADAPAGRSRHTRRPERIDALKKL